MLTIGYYLVNAIFYVFFLNINLGLFIMVNKLMSSFGKKAYINWIITNIVLLFIYTLLFFLTGRVS